jgi:hypothetical protein
VSLLASGPQAKIGREHLERLAVIYVRQSTLAQVRDHGESTQRQYALCHDAERPGSPADRVLVIDAGAIAEEGTPAELIAAGGWFARLANGGEEPEPEDGDTEDEDGAEDAENDDEEQTG